MFSLNNSGLPKGIAVFHEPGAATPLLTTVEPFTVTSCMGASALVINELSYNAKEKYLDLTDFYFGGCTLLGCDEEGNEIGEGMLGARADIADFCHKEPIFTYQEKMIEVLEKLNLTLSNFNNSKTDQKGGSTMNKFEELLAQYGVTAEDITFEVEGLSVDINLKNKAVISSYSAFVYAESIVKLEAFSN